MDIIQRVKQENGIVGRDHEIALSLAILNSGHNLLLEGPVGVGKTTVALVICKILGRKVIRIDADDRYTESKLTGWFDPPLVLKKGYAPESFCEGPLVKAMREGSILFINELNRMPEAVQNVLLPALDEKFIIIPHLGEIKASPKFQVIATQNPAEYIATSHLSEALRDRFEHVILDYQPEEEEIAIVKKETECEDLNLIREAVRIMRLTRNHPKVKKGASIRAAISMVNIAHKMGGGEALAQAARTSLPTRIELRDEFETSLNDLIEELLEREKKKLISPLIPLSKTNLKQKVILEPEEEGHYLVSLDELKKSLAARYRVPLAQIDGWFIAQRISEGENIFQENKLRKSALRMAVKEVMRRAWKLVGPVRPPKQKILGLFEEPYRGEVNLDQTLEKIIGKKLPSRDDLVIERREERRHQLVLIMDTSLSMGGKNLAIAALAAASLALKLHPGDFAVIVFGSSARALWHLNEENSPEELVSDILIQPARGFTNIEAGLETGLREIHSTHFPWRSALLITDGVYTVGRDPCHLAEKFPRLFVLLTEDYKMNEDLCYKLARKGRGDLFRIKGYEDLPHKILKIATLILR